MKIKIIFDGGCSHGNPGNIYGSYLIRVNDREVHRVSRKQFGRGTNNDAEFKTLIDAIDSTLGIVSQGVNDYDVEILTDSTIVANRVSGKKRNTVPQGPTLPGFIGGKKGPLSVDAAKRMGALAIECIDRLKRFRSFSIRWQSRWENVRHFGH